MLCLFISGMTCKTDKEHQKRTRHQCEVFLCNSGDHIACLGRPTVWFHKEYQENSDKRPVWGVSWFTPKGEGARKQHTEVNGGCADRKLRWLTLMVSILIFCKVGHLLRKGRKKDADVNWMENILNYSSRELGSWLPKNFTRISMKCLMPL